MSLRSILVVLAATMLLAGACAGGSTSKHHAVSASRLVLHPADLGHEWAPIASQGTGHVTLAQQLAQDKEPAAQDIDRRSFRGAFRAFSVSANRDFVLSEAVEYAATSDATTLYHGQQSLSGYLKKTHQRRVAVPSNAPGSDPILISTRLPVAGVETRGYLLFWQHGPVVELLMLLGNNADVRPSQVVALANHQDRLATTAGLAPPRAAERPVADHATTGATRGNASRLASACGFLALVALGIGLWQWRRSTMSRPARVRQSVMYE